MIPLFDKDGNLPIGVHFVTWEEFVSRFGITPHRQSLIAGLRRAIEVLFAAGCHTVYVDGSFVTEKAVPADYDACWELEGVDHNRLDPILIDFRYNRISQKVKYMGELFPVHSPVGDVGKQMLNFFQTDKNGNPKGIVAFNLRRMRL